MEEKKQSKFLHASRTLTIREAVEVANSLHLTKEDLVGILPEKNSYVLLYYC